MYNLAVWLASILERKFSPMTFRRLWFAISLLVGPTGGFAQENLTDSYREAAGRILGAAMTDVEGWEKLEHLTTEIGHRLSGSPQLERAIEWAFERMEREELHVRMLPVKVPHWVRGDESARLVAPVTRSLPILGLGSTPSG